MALSRPFALGALFTLLAACGDARGTENGGSTGLGTEGESGDSGADDGDIKRLRALVDQFSQDEVAAKTGEYSDANIEFHQAIIRMSGCPLISEITDGLFFHVRAIRHRSIFELDRARRSIVDHKEIVAAIEARDTERAERLVRDHTMKLRDHVEQYVELD